MSVLLWEAVIQDEYPEAWEALPSSYQNGECLEFSLDSEGNLWAEHDLGGDFLWNPNANTWIRFMPTNG